MTTQPLSEKEIVLVHIACYPRNDVKQAIQKTLKELKEFVTERKDYTLVVNTKMNNILKFIDTTFKKYIGEKLL